MSHLRRFGLAISLTVTLAGTTFAGETNSPPCVPGETNSPPCTTGQFTTDETSETSSYISGEVDTTVFEAASYAIESLLTLY